MSTTTAAAPNRISRSSVPSHACARVTSLGRAAGPEGEGEQRRLRSGPTGARSSPAEIADGRPRRLDVALGAQPPDPAVRGRHGPEHGRRVGRGVVGAEVVEQPGRGGVFAARHLVAEGRRELEVGTRIRPAAVAREEIVQGGRPRRESVANRRAQRLAPRFLAGRHSEGGYRDAGASAKDERRRAPPSARRAGPGHRPQRARRFVDGDAGTSGLERRACRSGHRHRRAAIGSGREHR